MIGNDIVDLQQASKESNWRRPGYLRKVFTTAEQQLITEAAMPHQMVWLLWSCKEAAYKAWSGENGERCYLPRKVEVRDVMLVSAKSYVANARIGMYNYQLKAHCEKGYVHTLATPISDVKVVVKTFPLMDTSHRHQSGAVRNSLIQYLVQAQRWLADDIRIDKKEYGQPVIYYQGEEMPIALSISHHGQYGGFALTI